MFSLAGKTAIVTGAASGIGAATAKRFAAAGAKVVLADLREAKELAQEIDGRAVVCDVADEAAVEAMIHDAAEGDGLDILVNNAGIGVVGQEIAETAASNLDANLRVNTYGAFYGVKNAARYMRNGGAIINVASLAALVGFPTYIGYSVSKAGIVALTRTAAIELGARGIRVNCICPSTVDTPMNDTPDVAAELAFVRIATPLGRICDADECAALIHFLAADDCRFITGQALVIDGGVHAGFCETLVGAVISAAMAGNDT